MGCTGEKIVNKGKIQEKISGKAEIQRNIGEIDGKSLVKGKIR